MFARTTNAILSTVGAAAFSQIPEFIQQYTQRLGGSVDSLSEARARISAEAVSFGRDVQTHVQNALSSTDPELQARGARDAATLSDLDQAQSVYATLVHSHGFARLKAFVEGFDPVIAEGTWVIFRPAVPLTWENLIYAGTGLVVGMIIAWCVEQPFRAFKKKSS
ncbi:MAG: DUF2937 family protein [Pseudomonadota bacterium]